MSVCGFLFEEERCVSSVESISEERNEVAVIGGLYKGFSGLEGFLGLGCSAMMLEWLRVLLGHLVVKRMSGFYNEGLTILTSCWNVQYLLNIPRSIFNVSMLMRTL